MENTTTSDLNESGRRSTEEIMSCAGHEKRVKNPDNGRVTVTWEYAKPAKTREEIGNQITAHIEARAWLERRKESLKKAAIELAENQKRIEESLLNMYEGMAKVGKG